LEAGIDIRIPGIDISDGPYRPARARVFVDLLNLSLTGVGPFGPSLTYMEFALKELKIRYRQKLGIPQAGS
jgi:hypothetical protein